MKIYNVAIIRIITTLGILCIATLNGSVFANNTPRDSEGRQIIYGPVTSGFYSNVRIISNSVGVYANEPTTIINSVIEAPICVRSNGYRLTMRGNSLDCRLCVEFTGRTLIDNQLVSNRCSGQGTNRQDIFRW